MPKSKNIFNKKPQIHQNSRKITQLQQDIQQLNKLIQDLDIPPTDSQSQPQKTSKTSSESQFSRASASSSFSFQATSESSLDEESPKREPPISPVHCSSCGKKPIPMLGHHRGNTKSNRKKIKAQQEKILQQEKNDLEHRLKMHLENRNNSLIIITKHQS